MQEIAVFLKQYLIEQSRESYVDYQLKYTLTEHLCFISPEFAADGELLCWEHPLKDLCGKTFQGALHDDEHDYRRQEDGPLVRVRLGALWKLIMQLVPVVKDLSNVHESPSSAKYDSWVEQYAFITQD